MTELKIEDYDKIVPDAFHGTSFRVAKKIIDDGFEPSRGQNHFLGDGVYFFESSQWHAQNWALRHRSRSSDKIAVIQSIINLGHCLDLHNEEHRRIIRDTALDLRQRGKKGITDAVVINLLATKFSIIDSIRATYISIDYGSGQRVFEGSRFYDYVQLMICVRKVEHILSISLVYSGYGS